MLSIIIPSYRDPHLEKTIEGIKKNARGVIEIIPMTDESFGMRTKINQGVDKSKGDYIMKCDSHNMFDEGFDVKLLNNIQDNWVVVPRRYKLDVDNWSIINEDPIDYDKLVKSQEGDRICGVHWTNRRIERKDIFIDETMTFQGSCYVMSRKHWDWLGGLQTKGYGEFCQESTEIALKTWLGGGKVMVNKNTWYAHKHRKFKRTYRFSQKDIDAGNAYSMDYWINNRWDKRIHDLSWLMKRFGCRTL